jgi:hypothetical protein
VVNRLTWIKNTQHRSGKVQLRAELGSPVGPRVFSNSEDSRPPNKSGASLSTFPDWRCGSSCRPEVLDEARDVVATGAAARREFDAQDAEAADEIALRAQPLVAARIIGASNTARPSSVSTTLPSTCLSQSSRG